MVVEAIRLLTGGRAEQHMVRVGAAEAIVEGRFHDGDEEIVLQRVIRRDGRSRCSINGDMATATALGERGASLVDLHGQHGHQTLLHGTAQREALDAFAGVDTSKLTDALRRLRHIQSQLEGMGGDAPTRLREIDLLQYQLDELDRAKIEDADEDARLRTKSELLSDALDAGEATNRLGDSLSSEAGLRFHASEALRIVMANSALSSLREKLESIAVQTDELIAEAGALTAAMDFEPDELDAVQQRRALLKQLQRKYGADLREVIEYRDSTRRRLDELVRHDDVVAELELEREKITATVEKLAKQVRKERRKGAPLLANGVERRLRDLALPHARFVVVVPDEGSGDAVSFELGPNPGMPVLPVAKAASGGELARTMLALRLSLLESSEKVKQHPPTLVFDEVDAGIGGEAAALVGRALSELSRGTNNQVFVVTHLPQVAAFADHQVSVRKDQEGGHTVSAVLDLTASEREVELARMLSGRPDSESGREHARELLKKANT